MTQETSTSTIISTPCLFVRLPTCIVSVAELNDQVKVASFEAYHQKNEFHCL